MKKLKVLMTLASICLGTGQAFADGHQKSMWDVIVNDGRFSTFAVMVENAGVQNLFDERNKINATLYVPTNEAFTTMPESANSALRIPVNKGPLTKLIKSHYFVGTQSNMKPGDYYIARNINGDQIKIAQESDLFVKDMVVRAEPIKVGRSKIIPVDCVMFVQPSSTDYRLSREQQEQSAITSCCLRSMKEVAAFLSTIEFVEP
jgi:uncharacterized surface protein with fasciclin (FAS1) repeats